MLGSRRSWLAISVGAVGVFATQPLPLFGQHSPQPIPSPHAPDPNFPPGLDGPDLKQGTNNKSADPQIQREIKGDVLKLYELASELKVEVEKTDASSTLSLSVVKTAQQIEKLAKQIKNLARG
jgi:hypothetical protein